MDDIDNLRAEADKGQPLPEIKATAADLTAVSLLSLPADRSMGGSCHIYDDAQKLFIAFSSWPAIDSNNTWVVVNQYPAGTLLTATLPPPVQTWRVFPPPGLKITGNPVLSHRGIMLTATISAFTLSTTPRIPSLIGVDVALVYAVGSTPPPPPPPTTGDLVITSPAAMVGTWRRVSSGFDRAKADIMGKEKNREPKKA